jgi:hypothetical protein
VSIIESVVSPAAVAAHKVGDTTNPMALKNAPNRENPIPEADFPNNPPISPNAAKRTASGTNKKPKVNIPRTAKTQLNIPSVRPGLLCRIT